ncbi:MAG: prenyltransferase [Vulcanimicrobiaceae bacterium]
MTPLAAFVKLSRPIFLAGGALGVTLGAAMAARSHHHLVPATLLHTQVAVTAFQLMTHYTNDYFDRPADAFAVRTIFSGGSGMLGAHLQPRVAIMAALACLATGAAALFALFVEGAHLATLIGILIALGAWCYSSPPVRLLARGLGEIDSALVVGMLVPLFAYTASGAAVSSGTLLAVLVPVCAMFILMICVEVPDLDADARGSKRNLLVRYGPTMAPRAIAVSALAMASLALFLSRTGGPPLLASATLPPLLACAFVLRELDRRPSRHGRIAAGGVAVFVATTLGCAIAYGVGA